MNYMTIIYTHLITTLRLVTIRNLGTETRVVLRCQILRRRKGDLQKDETVDKIDIASKFLRVKEFGAAVHGTRKKESWPITDVLTPK